MAKLTPTSDVDPVLEQQIKGLQAQAAAEYEARRTGGQAQWMRPESLAAQEEDADTPDDWDGSLFDYAGMALPFSREASNQALIEAVKDPATPGTAGDLLVTTTQIEYLAVMERSFMARHTMSRTRAMLHTLGRKYGHGHNRGPLVQAVLEHVRGLVKTNKGGAA